MPLLPELEIVLSANNKAAAPTALGIASVNAPRSKRFAKCGARIIANWILIRVNS
jgi:hypothetical protein